MANAQGKYQLGWVIRVLSKDDEFQIELADLGNGKHMIIATDLKYLVGESTYRQAGFGPFVLDSGVDLDIYFGTLKDDLRARR